MTTAVAPLDVARLREEFPLLGTTAHGRPLVYLDSAATSQKPRSVIRRITRFYERENANIHRGVYALSADATAEYDRVRARVARFLGATPEEIVFTRGTTESINLVAQSWGRGFLRAGDEIVVTAMEHHSNLVPWQMLARRRGAVVRYLSLTSDGRLDPESLEELAAVENVKVVAATHVSNSLASVNDVPALSAWAHERGAVMVCDGAQAAPHMPVDVRALGCDFYAISGHKMCGPGAGALWGREELFERMDPFMTGGGQIGKVELDGTTWNELPYKFEPGVPPLAEVVGFGAAIDYVNGIGLEAIHAHEQALVRYGWDVLSSVPGVTVYGPPPPDRAGILSFTVEDVHPHDVAQVLDSEAICVRAGHHCTQPAMRRFGLVATARASLYLYNTAEDFDRLAAGIEKVKRTFGV